MIAYKKDKKLRYMVYINNHLCLMFSMYEDVLAFRDPANNGPIMYYTYFYTM